VQSDIFHSFVRDVRAGADAILLVFGAFGLDPLRLRLFGETTTRVASFG